MFPAQRRNAFSPRFAYRRGRRRWAEFWTMAFSYQSAAVIGFPPIYSNLKVHMKPCSDNLLVMGRQKLCKRYLSHSTLRHICPFWSGPLARLPPKTGITTSERRPVDARTGHGLTAPTEVFRCPCPGTEILVCMKRTTAMQIIKSLRLMSNA